jgi:carbonic anhydrase/acetyltransferase-like protein (isoleucine patch superfamily)
LIHPSAFIAPDAQVLGDVTIEENVGIWYHTTIRGDRASIHIGKGSNVQDNCVVHVGSDQPVTIGDNVTIGHSAVVHGCTIGDNTLIGMGAILMNGASVGSNCIIGAGSLVTQNAVIPNDSLVLGSPGKVIRSVTREEIQANLTNAKLYVEEAQSYKISIQ